MAGHASDGPGVSVGEIPGRSTLAFDGAYVPIWAVYGLSTALVR